MLTQLNHMLMAVPNLDACRKFYSQALGLPEIAGKPSDNGQALCRLQVGPSQLVLGVDSATPVSADAATAPGPGIDHFALYVADLDAAYAALTARGVEFTGEPHTTELGHRNMQRALVTCVDPNGFHIQLAQVVDPRSQLQGRRAAKEKMTAAAPVGGPVFFGGIDHISTYCTDFSAMRAFYKDLLGLEEFFHSTTREAGLAVAAGFEQAAFAVGGTDIELATDETWHTLGPGPIRQLGFETEDIERTYAVLERRGASIDGPVSDGPWRSFMLRGPDALIVQIMQRG